MIEEPHGVGRAEGVDLRRLEEEAEEAARALVAHEDVPAPVDHQGGIRLLLAQGELEGAPHLGHLRSVEPALVIDRRVPRGEEQLVPAARGHLEHPGEKEDHVAARVGAARLEKAQVPGGDLRVESEGELAAPPALAPLANEPAHRTGRHRLLPASRENLVRHAGSLQPPPGMRHYLAGNCGAGPRHRP
jgi:hypothetical protein